MIPLFLCLLSCSLAYCGLPFHTWSLVFALYLPKKRWGSENSSLLLQHCRTCSLKAGRYTGRQRFKSLANHCKEKPKFCRKWYWLRPPWVWAFQKSRNLYTRIPPNVVTILSHMISYAGSVDTWHDTEVLRTLLDEVNYSIRYTSNLDSCLESRTIFLGDHAQTQITWSF